MLSGTEKRGDTEIVFGANWTIVSEKTDTSNSMFFRARNYRLLMRLLK